MNFVASKFDVDTPKIESLIETHGLLETAKILSERVRESLDNVYVAGVLYAHYIRQVAMNERDLLTKYSTLFNAEVREFMLEHYDTLESIIVHERDYRFQYSSVKAIVKNYLFKIEGIPVESIQWMWMRVAVQVASPDNWRSITLSERLRDVVATYDMLSLGVAIHGTPTCVNAGFHQPQLESCFLISVGDNMLSIAESEKLLNLGSKLNAGFGFEYSRIRHSRVANRGMTKGVPGLLKVFNAILPYPDQLGSRPATLTAHLSIDHVDILDFIRMKDSKAPPSLQCTNLNYCVVSNDLFEIRALQEPDPTGKDPYRGMWSLFCPREVQKLWVKLNGGNVNDSSEVDKAPCLADVWGKEYEELYTLCERNGIARTTLRAKDLFDKIEIQRAQSGEPYKMFKDNANRKSNHNHLGTITQSNLCQEIIQYTKPVELMATCDLATINVASLVSGKGIDWKRLGDVTRLLTRNLDRVIDRTSGVVPNEGQIMVSEMLKSNDPAVKSLALKLEPHIQKDPGYTSRMMNRAFGIGIMGFASALSLLGIEFDSKEAAEIGARIRACIYWHSVDESATLAQDKGPYPAFEGSPMSKGILQPDMWIEETKIMTNLVESMGLKDNKYLKRYSWPIVDPSEFGVDSTWDALRERVKKGIRNSLTTCQPPNATTASAFGVSPSIEPFYSMVYTESNINGMDVRVCDSLRDVLIENGLYDPKIVGEYLIENKGYITGLHKMFPNDKAKCMRVESLFKSAFQVNKKFYPIMVQRMGYYVDQSQSLNIFFDKPNYVYTGNISRMLWINGCKNIYYLRRLATTDKISTNVGSAIDTGAQFCARNGDCISCQ